MLEPEALARYGRHVSLAQIGAQGQRKLLDARVLIIGLGGLGSPAAMYLASSGVGELVLCDYDQVELSNLQRQIVHTTDDVGRHKVDSARDTIARLNPGVTVIALARALDDDELRDEVTRADLVIDACDNFETRFTLNRICLETRTPWVSGAALRMEGQVTVFDPRREDSPCYRCLYSDDGATEGEPCALVGVLAPLLGIVGSIQATEAIKLITGAGETLVGRVVVIDALELELRTLRLRRNPDCPACARSH